MVLPDLSLEMKYTVHLDEKKNLGEKNKREREREFITWIFQKWLFPPFSLSL